jgi:hypothetical protein
MSSESSNQSQYNWTLELKRKTDGFGELLDTIGSLDDKTKLLWKDIYTNAFNDRMLAQNLYDNLWEIVHVNPDLHAIHGASLSKYVERLSRCNDQLIKLADLVEKAKEKDDEIDGGAIYGKIGQK